MNRCRTCVIPDTRPDTHFDETGQCSACRSYANRPQIDWQERKAELLKLLDRHDGRCIVPSSGGKDSTYIALTLKELGADVTAVTATTCMLTEIGRKNLDNLARHVMTVEITPNRDVRSKLNRIGLDLVGDASWPQHASIWAIPFRVAVKFHTPLMVWGENSQDQYGGPPGAESARHMTRRWCSEFGGLNGLRAADFVGMEGITARDMEVYELPSDADLQRAGIEAHFLGAYIPWDSHRNARMAIEHGLQIKLPCAANLWEHENLDCLVTPTHDYFGFLKYGFGRGAAQASVDVRSGRMARADAMQFVRECDGLFPLMYLGIRLEEVLQHIGVTKNRYLKACNTFMNRDLFVEPRVEWGQHLTLKEFA